MEEGCGMNVTEVVKSVTNKIYEEFGFIDFSYINPEELAETVRKLKNEENKKM